MKAAFFSLATLAFTAFAAPVVQDSLAIDAGVATVVVEREAHNAGDIINALTKGNSEIKQITGSLSMFPL